MKALEFPLVILQNSSKKWMLVPRNAMPRLDTENMLFRERWMEEDLIDGWMLAAALNLNLTNFINENRYRCQH